MNISSRLVGNLNILYCLIWCFCSFKRTQFNLIRLESYRSIKVNRMALLRMASLIPLNIRHKAKTLCYFPKAKTLLTDSCLYRSINLYIVKPNPDISSNFTNSARNYQDLKHFRWIKINLRNQKATSNNSMIRNISNLLKKNANTAAVKILLFVQKILMLFSLMILQPRFISWEN